MKKSPKQYSSKHGLLDHFILTFKCNDNPKIITVKDGEIVPAQWLMDMTFEEVEHIGQTDKGIEVAIPIGTFLQIKDGELFQHRCRNLIRLRTTPRTTLCALCHPINDIDNSL